MKRKLYAVWNWTILIVQRGFKGFFQVYATITMPMAMWIGCILIVAGYMERIVGEERAIELATKHPYWFLFGAAIFMIGTCGLGYWAWTTSVSEIDAGFDRRKAKYSRLFRVASTMAWIEVLPAAPSKSEPVAATKPLFIRPAGYVAYVSPPIPDAVPATVQEVAAPKPEPIPDTQLGWWASWFRDRARNKLQRTLARIIQISQD